MEVRLRSSTNANWGFSLFKLVENYSNVIGETIFGKWHIATTPEFQTYKYTRNQTVFIRYISFNIEGEIGTTVIWDYFKIIVGKKTWYWNIDTGEFDGTSFKVGRD